MLYTTILSHGLSVCARTHYVTANGVRNGLEWPVHLIMKADVDPSRSAPRARKGGGVVDSCECPVI